MHTTITAEALLFILIPKKKSFKSVTAIPKNMYEAINLNSTSTNKCDFINHYHLINKSQCSH